METVKYTIDCWAYFGKVDWDLESTYDYIASAKKVYELFETKATHYGFSAIPYGIIKGAHIGSARNVTKKVEAIYSQNASLKTLEFFSLPKNYTLQYSEYGIYISRSKDFIVIGYDTELFPAAPVEKAILEMKKHIAPVWGEHFQIAKGKQPFVHCMDKFGENPKGENLVSNTYVGKMQPIHIIEQFRV